MSSPSPAGRPLSRRLAGLALLAAAGACVPLAGAPVAEAAPAGPLTLTPAAANAAALAAVGYGGPRQYYGGWRRAPQRQYVYRSYYYKPRPTYHGYRHNYVIYNVRRDPKHFYYYNPYKRTYWGRCPVNTGGEPLYSMLEEQYRKPSLDQIPLDKFPVPAGLPPIPESADGLSLELPPDDLPELSGLPG